MESGTALDLTKQELTSIEQYRLRRETSVLVVLFTDIKSFTALAERHGDTHALDLLREHDQIVTAAVEEGGAGLVVKHIGDSVMAVFAEPSTAVERALRIQERSVAYNALHAGREPLSIRIGLHMGQVAVENQTRLDLVGRHVNRASRIETLADGGQIFLTYPVFDSARGWLQSRVGREIAWQLHGDYRLKGLDEPVAVYEVYDPRHRRPLPPRGARRHVSLRPLWLAAGVLAAGLALAFGWTRYQRAEVSLSGWNREPTILDQRETLALGGGAAEETRPVLTPIVPGHHLLQQDINWQVRNCMEVDIRRGLNVLRPAFTSVYLPTLGRRLDFEPGAEEQLEASETYAYPLYGKDNRRLDTKAQLSVSIKGLPDKTDPDVLVFTCAWKVVENGVIVSADSRELRSRASDDESHNATVTLHEDALHYWYLRTFTSRWSAELEVGAAYIEYKDK